MGAPGPKPIVAKAENAAEDGLPLGGVETHAYLQCGIERLRGLFGADGDVGGGGGGDGGGVLTVELLHRGKTGDNDGVWERGDDRDLVRCYCEVTRMHACIYASAEPVKTNVKSELVASDP